MAITHHTTLPFFLSVLLLLLPPTLPTPLRSTPEPQADPLFPSNPASQLLLVPLPLTRHPDILLTSGTNQICPTTTPQFTIECITPGTDPSKVNFYVNDTYARTERYPPYYLAGDHNNVVFPWIPPTSDSVWRIRCEPEGREPVEATIVLDC